jgi:hypothetical protein
MALSQAHGRLTKRSHCAAQPSFWHLIDPESPCRRTVGGERGPQSTMWPGRVSGVTPLERPRRPFEREGSR